VNGGAKDPAEVKEKNHSDAGGNVVFADGHAEWWDVGQWSRASWPRPAGLFYHR
jgi:prepilin-type processing-associated H-X9-DG protein